MSEHLQEQEEGGEVSKSTNILAFKLEKFLEDLGERPVDAKSVFGLGLAVSTWEISCVFMGDAIADALKGHPQLLLDRLGTANEQEALALIHALGELKARQALPVLREYLDGDTAEIRTIAAKAIASIDGKDNARALAEALLKEDDLLGMATIGETVAEIGLPRGDVELSKTLHEHLLGTSKEGSWINREARAATLEALAETDGDEVAAMMLAALGDDFQIVVNTARRWFEKRVPQYVDWLIASSNMKGPYGRGAIARVLVKVKDPEIEPVLCELLERCGQPTTCSVLARRLANTKSEAIAAGIARAMKRNVKAREPALHWIVKRKTSCFAQHLKDLYESETIWRHEYFRALLALDEDLYHRELEAHLALDDGEPFQDAVQEVENARMFEYLPQVAAGLIRNLDQWPKSDVMDVRDVCKLLYRDMERSTLQIPVSLREKSDELMSHPVFKA